MEVPFLQNLILPLLSLVAGTVFGTEIARFMYRPLVFVRYEEIAPLKESNGVYWTIVVSNKGRTAATGCKGVISLPDISACDILDRGDADPEENLPEYRKEDKPLKTPRDQLVERNKFRKIRNESLAWAAVGNPESVTINPGTSSGLDICKFQMYDQSPYFIFPSEEGWRVLRVRIKSERISGKILVCPENDFPTVISFSVFVNDEGESVFEAHRPRPSERLKTILSRERSYFR